MKPNYRLLTMLVALIVLLAGSFSPIVAKADDKFSQLEGIKIGDEIPVTILSMGTRDLEAAGEVYTFDSERYSHPHIVYLMNNRVSFIQLTIPEDSQERYQGEFRFFGPPEERLPKTRSEIMYGYPSKGLAFIINGYSGNVERVQKFAPKSAEEFRNQEGKNFTPVDINRLLSTSGPPSVSPSPAPVTKFHRWLERVPSWVLLTVFLFSMAGSVGLLLWLFRTWRAKNGQN